jgi:hypothetical protein
MDQSPWASSSASQDVSSILYAKGHCSVCKSPPVVPILSELNPVHTLPTIFLMFCINIYAQVFQMVLLLQVSPPMRWAFRPIRTAHLAFLMFLDFITSDSTYLVRGNWDIIADQFRVLTSSPPDELVEYLFLDHGRFHSHSSEFVFLRYVRLYRTVVMVSHRGTVLVVRSEVRSPLQLTVVLRKVAHVRSVTRVVAATEYNKHQKNKHVVVLNHRSRVFQIYCV